MQPFGSRVRQTAYAHEHSFVFQAGQDVILNPAPVYPAHDPRPAYQQWAELLPEYRQQYAEHRVALGEGHPETLRVQRHLGQAAAYAGELTEACGVLGHLLGLSRALLGAAHPDTISAAALLADCLGWTGRNVQARDLFTELERSLPPTPAYDWARHDLRRLLLRWQEEVARERGYSARDKRGWSRVAQERWRKGIS
ncbi:hypothetical protein ACQPYE_39980 [Actinosynnema sp. CA-299493]